MAKTLTLTPIGAGAAYGRANEAQSAYLVGYGETRLCLDLGAGTLNRLTRLLPPEDLDAVVITHMHADHCIDLLSLRIYMVYGPGRGRELPVFGPVGLRERLGTVAGGDEWGGCRFADIDSQTTLRFDDLTVRFAEVPHLAPTFAVRVDSPVGSLTYGADCGPNEALAAFAAGSDLLIAECSLGAAAAPADSIHLGGPDAGAIGRRAGVGSLLLTHCYPEHDRTAAARAAADAFGAGVGWAEEGREVSISVR